MHTHLYLILQLEITKCEKIEQKHVLQNSKTSDSSIYPYKNCLQFFPN